MTRKPHDALFKAGFETPANAADLLRHILPTTVADAIDWHSIARQPGTFIAPDLADRHSDLLFSARLVGSDEPVLIYLLLEHQSSSDTYMVLRMLEYLVRIWQWYRKLVPGARSLPLIVPVVLSHDPAGWTAPCSFHDLFVPPPDTVAGLPPFVPSFSLLVEDLARLDDEVLHVWNLPPSATVTLVLLRDGRELARIRRSMPVWVPRMRELMDTPGGRIAVEQALRYLLRMLGQMRFEEFHVMITEQIPATEEIMMTIADELEARGEARGLARGRVATLTKLLSLKFGPLSTDHIARLASATAEELDLYIERILTAAKPEDVFEPT
jgi:predicted transposase YdaD